MKGTVSQSVNAEFEIINFQLRLETYDQLKEHFYVFKLQCEVLPRIKFCKQAVYVDQSPHSQIFPSPDDWVCYTEPSHLSDGLEAGAKKLVALNPFEESVLNEIFLAIQSDRDLPINAYLAYCDKKQISLQEEAEKLLKQADALKRHMIDIMVDREPRIVQEDKPKGINCKDGLENAIAKLTEIEGEDWAKRQGENSGCTVTTLYLAWQRMQNDAPHLIEEDPNDIVDPRMWNLPGDGSIHGEGGTRYFVLRNGTIAAFLLWMLKYPAKCHKIDELGICWK